MCFYSSSSFEYHLWFVFVQGTCKITCWARFKLFLRRNWGETYVEVCWINTELPKVVSFCCCYEDMFALVNVLWVCFGVFDALVDLFSGLHFPLKNKKIFKILVFHFYLTCSSVLPFEKCVLMWAENERIWCEESKKKSWF